MTLLGIRFCKVAAGDDAPALAESLGDSGLGLNRQKMEMPEGMEGFPGAVFPLDEGSTDSWVEIWQANEHMPEMTMLQLVVDDADAYAARARKTGLDVQGPFDAHGERIYSVSELPGGMALSFQSKLAEG